MSKHLTEEESAEYLINAVTKGQGGERIKVKKVNKNGIRFFYW